MSNNSQVFEDSCSQEKEEKDIFSNMNYLCQAGDFINESLKRGNSVIQFGDGSIFVSETRVVYIDYVWDPKTNKMVQKS